MNDNNNENKKKTMGFEELFPIDEEILNTYSGELDDQKVSQHDTYDSIAKEAFEKAYKKEEKKRRMIVDLIWFAALVMILALTFQYIVGLSFIDGDSMYPTLHDKNIVVYSRINKSINHNDIIAIRMEDKVFYVKRVIAVEGDVVDIEDGLVVVNGKAIDEAYVWGETRAISNNISYPIKVGKGQVFVLGDNREHSVDSRSFGLVYPYQVRGKLLYYAGTLY